MSRICQQHGAEPTTLKDHSGASHGKSRSDFRKHVAEQKSLRRLSGLTLVLKGRVIATTFTASLHRLVFSRLGTANRAKSSMRHVASTVPM